MLTYCHSAGNFHEGILFLQGGWPVGGGHNMEPKKMRQKSTKNNPPPRVTGLPLYVSKKATKRDSKRILLHWWGKG